VHGKLEMSRGKMAADYLKVYSRALQETLRTTTKTLWQESWPRIGRDICII